jgi:hypothetical protein
MRERQFETPSALLAGAARAVITPPVGWPLQGFGPDYGYSTGVHDDLHARAIVLSCASARAAIVALDVCGVPRRDAGRMAREVQTRAGVPAENVSICASHNHHSPGIANLYTDNRAPSDAYVRSVVAAVGDAAAEAAARLEPVRLVCGSCLLDLNLNRRVEMPDGTVKDLPWNRDLLPNGPVDRQLWTVHFAGEEGPVATLYNYAAHAICLGDDIHDTSADFPGVASAWIERGGGGIALFLNGACGNVHPRDFQKGYAAMEAMGRTIGDAVLGTVRDGRRESVGKFLCAQREVAVPLRPGSEAHLAAEHLAEGRFDGRNIQGPIKAYRVGDVAIVMIPCEYFTEFGMEIKARSPFARTLVVSVSNDYLDYASTPEQFLKGGYEVRSTVFTADSGRILTDAALERLECLRGTGSR